MTNFTKTTVTVSTNVSTSLEKAWDYFTNPNHVVNWNFASDDWHCPSASTDLKVGGKMTSRMEAKDGSFGFDLTATYLEVVENEKLVYQLEDSRLVEVIFTQNGDAVDLTQTFEIEDQNSKELQQQGWQAILNNYKKLVESN